MMWQSIPDAAFALGLLKKELARAADGSGASAAAATVRRLAQHGFLLLLWQLVTNRNPNFEGQAKKLRVRHRARVHASVHASVPHVVG